MQEQNTPNSARMNKRNRSWGIPCLVLPFVLVVVVILLYALTNFVAATITPATPHGGDAIFYETPIWATILNMIYFAVGGIAAIALVPALIVGIILLASQKPTA